MTDHAFLLVKPEACGVAFLDFATTFLRDAGVSVEECVTRPTAELKREDVVERHYANTHRYATAAADTLDALIHHSDTVKSRFFAAFGELWDNVVAQGRLLPAHEAMVVLGNLTPQELSDLWWGNSAMHAPDSLGYISSVPVRLFRGLRVVRLSRDNVYVINGHYPALHARMTREAGTSSCGWITLSWPESRYTWEQLSRDIIGVPDPQLAVVTSLRYAYAQRYTEWGLRTAPTMELNGFELSPGPLAAMAARVLWAGRQVEDDEFGRYLLQEGLPALFVRRLLRNPLLLQADTISSVSDMLLHQHESRALHTLSELYVHLREVEQGGDGAKDATLVYDAAPDGAPVHLTEGCEQAELVQRRNHAIVFVKPHAYHKRVFHLIRETLTRRVRGLTVDQVRDVDAAWIERHGVIDRHYGLLSYYAMTVAPADLTLSEATQDTFREKFGLTWQEANAQGRVWNARAALHLLGECSPVELFQCWSVASVMRLCSGAYVGRLHLPDATASSSTLVGFGGAEDAVRGRADTVFVINGFYPYVREMFVSPDSRVHCLAISWPEASLSWADFRAGIVGSTDPRRAPAESLRGLVLRQWHDLGLGHEPNTTENALHASAGPLEAMVERHLWFGTSVEDDALTRRLRTRGLSAAMALQWAGNPLVHAMGSSRSGGEEGNGDVGHPDRVFDLVENVQTSEFVQVVRQAEQHALARCRDEGRTNHALVLLHPSAVTERSAALVADVLTRANVRIEAHGSRFRHSAARRVLQMPAMRELRRLALLRGAELRTAFPAEAAASFAAHFHKTLQAAEEQLCGAWTLCMQGEGAERMSPSELMQRWSAAQPVRLARHCHVAYLASCHRYVVNGFLPYFYEAMSLPESRWYYYAVRWQEKDWSWHDFSTILIGDADVQTAAAGSLQRTVSERWKELGLGERPCVRAQCSISASAGPLEAIAERALWLMPDEELDATAPLALDELYARRLDMEPMMQCLLMHGVPRPLVVHYAWAYKASQCSRAVSAETGVRQRISGSQQSSDCVRQLSAVAAEVRRECGTQHAFLWLHPFATCDAVIDAIPSVLAAHKVRVCGSGQVTMAHAVAHNLLDSTYSALYRNAWTRRATQMPLSQAERDAFAVAFELSWQTAVELSLVLNAREAVQRLGEACALHAWDAATRKARLSPALYVAHLEREGIYVVNGFYPYVRARLYSGERVVWFDLAFHADNAAATTSVAMTWDSFLTNTIGDTARPREAVPGSLVHHLTQKWRDYGLAGPPDEVMSGLHVSPSPVAAMTERCAWRRSGDGGEGEATTAPEEDVLGRLLWRAGLAPAFLRDLMHNPLVYHQQPSPQAMHDEVREAFDLLPVHDTSALIATLRQWQHDPGLVFLAADTIFTPSVTPLTTTCDVDGRDGVAADDVPGTNGAVLQHALARAVPVAEHYRLPVFDPTLPISELPEVGETVRVGGAQKARAPQSIHTARPGVGEVSEGRRRSRLDVDHNSVKSTNNNANGAEGDAGDADEDDGDEAAAAAEAGTGTSDGAGVSHSSALLMIDPACLTVSRPTPTFSIDVYRDVVLPLLRDHLAAHCVSIVYEGLLPAAEADARLLFTRHHASLMRYATQTTAVYDVMRSAAQQARFAQVFGQPLSAVQLHTAHDLAAEFNLTAANVDELWNMCSPVACFAHDLYIGKLATDDVYIVNGFAPRACEQFHSPVVDKPYVIVSWQDRAMSYERFCNSVIGQPHLAEAEAGSLQVALQRGAVAAHLGLSPPAQPFLGFVQSSTSALSAMQQRELWLQLSLHCDPLGRKVLADYYVSPCVLRWALSNPVCHRAREASDAVYLFDLLRGQTTRPTLQHLSFLEDAHRQEPPRNTALLVIQPHALCSRLARRVEHSLSEHGIRIDEEGDVGGGVVRERGVVRYLYPVHMSYAVRDPATIVLTPAEQDRFYDVFGLTWQELVLTGTVLNAYQALQAFAEDDATPQRLYRDSRAARSRLWLRPALEVAELTERGVFVINGYMPALKESFESPRALLHWYVVSWPESKCGWRAFVQDVVGNADPQCAAPQSIRGRLFRHWREYGLHTIPDCIQNGIHVSDSPLQALGERLRLLQRPLIEDPLGDLLLRDDVHLGLLRLWLDNPDVVAHGVTAGVLEHVTDYDTSRLVQTLSSVSKALRATQDATLHSAAPDTSSLAAPDEEEARQATQGEAHVSDTREVAKVAASTRPAEPALRGDAASPAATSEFATAATAAAQDNLDASWGSRMQLPDDSLLLFRNAAALVLKPHIARNAAAVQLLLDILQKHQIHVVGTGEREATAGLVDELCFTQAFYALHKNVASALQHDARLSSEDGAAHFAGVFGEPWAAVCADASRLMSAKRAMQCLNLSPSELYANVTASDGAAATSWSIGHDLVITRLTSGGSSVYVVNGRYPAEQASLLYTNTDSGAGGDGAATCMLTMLLVVWDERQLSWRAFAEAVIGDEVPSRALAGSFRAELLRQGSALALAAAPEACDNGVLVSASPLQAFAQRTAWFGVSAYVPDTLVRSASYAALDAGVLLSWAENPLVAYSSTLQAACNDAAAASTISSTSSTQSPAVVCRIFDLCHHMDTSELLRLVRGAETQVRRLGPRRDLQLKAEDVVTQDLRGLAEPQSAAARRHAPEHGTLLTRAGISAPEHRLTRKTGTEATARTEGPATAAASETRTAVPPPTRLCSEDTLQNKLTRAHPRLHRSIVRDALLNARGTDAVGQLWEYYVALSNKRVNEKDRTIDFALFRNDYDALEDYGVPFLHPELRRLFDKVAMSGRMRYDEFARALALYQTL